MTQRVLLIGVDQEFFSILASRLQLLQLEIRRALQGLDAVALLERSCTDTILMDADTPDAGSTELCKTLRVRHLSCPILVCAQRSLALDAVLYYEAGADDYFEKSVDWVVIEAKIRRALRRCDSCRCRDRWTVTDDFTQLGSDKSDGVPRIDYGGLTRTEERLLGVLVASRGRVVSKSMLVSQVWGRPQCEAKSLYEHVSTLRAKLLPTGWAIVNVRGNGYRLQNKSVPGSQSRPND